MKNKGIIITMGIVIIILIGVIIFLLLNNNQNESSETTSSDASKFAEEYTLVDKDNKFRYAISFCRLF